MPRSIHDTALVAAAFAGLLLAASGCMVVHDHPRGGVPPDGYVVHHRVGVELVWVASLGVYRVSGYPNCYYYSGRFYRDRGGYWETSSAWKGRWKKAHPHGVPPGLAKKKRR